MSHALCKGEIAALHRITYLNCRSTRNRPTAQHLKEPQNVPYLLQSNACRGAATNRIDNKAKASGIRKVMSRGFGRVQAHSLALLKQHERAYAGEQNISIRCLTTNQIGKEIFETQWPSRSQMTTLRRALWSLVDAGYAWRIPPRRWTCSFLVAQRELKDDPHLQALVRKARRDAGAW